jgi:hypothetical protein
MRKHEFKTWPRFFDALVSGELSFCTRKIDPVRDVVEVGDEVTFREFDPRRGATRWTGFADNSRGGDYTGRFIRLRVTYVLRGDNAVLPFGWFVMGLAPDAHLRKHAVARLAADRVQESALAAEGRCIRLEQEDDCRTLEWARAVAKDLRRVEAGLREEAAKQGGGA